VEVVYIPCEPQRQSLDAQTKVVVIMVVKINSLIVKS